MPKIIAGSLGEHREQMRERLCDALLRLLAERGYDAISLADIAAAAEVGRTAVYNHFPDKESVLLALVESQTDAYLERLRSSLAAVKNPVAQLEAFVRAQMSEIARSHVNFSGLGPALSEQGRGRIMAHVRPMAAILGSILRAGIDQRYLPDQDVDTSTNLVFAASGGRMVAHLEGDQLAGAIDATVSFVRRGVGARLTADGRPQRLRSG